MFERIVGMLLVFGLLVIWSLYYRRSVTKK